MDAVFILIVLFAVGFLVAAYASRGLKRSFKAQVQAELKHNAIVDVSLLCVDLIAHLPQPVQKYLAFIGALGKPRVYNFRLCASGEMKLSPKADWESVQVKQYDFFTRDFTRFFYISLAKLGLPVFGLHAYTREDARMTIKAAGLIKVVDIRGRELRKTETVTLFNDMCLFAPATLIDERIQWETLDPLTVKAVFTVEDCSISAVLTFKETGELVNFVSDDRSYLKPDGSLCKFRWSTPISQYEEQSGVRIVSRAEAVWTMSQGDFAYFRFTKINDFAYNSSHYS